MRARFRILAFATALAVFAGLIVCTALCAAAQQSPGAFFAVSDGRGQISLLWFPPPDRWPLGGWRLTDSRGRVLVQHIPMGDPEALKALSAADASAIRKLPQVLGGSTEKANRRKQLINILGLRAFSEPAYARALGLSWVLKGVAPGSRTYEVVGLNSSDKPSGLTLTSPPVDSAVATALPPAPSNLRAQARRDGVALLWSAVPESRQLPVIAYVLSRDSSAKSGVEITAKPIVLGTKWDPKIPVFLDRAAPVEQMLTYHITSMDIFGRRSEPADIKIFFPDFAALQPPEPVSATAGANKVSINWKPRPDPHTAGYVVERAYLYSGPYEALTPQALPPGTKNFDDTHVRGGTAYYYRVRAVGPRGDLGSPSDPAMAQPSNAAAPPKPANLKAEVGKTRVRLTWDPVPFPVAGYFVERLGARDAAVPDNSRAKSARATEEGKWVRLNSHVTPEPLYDDYFGLTSDAKLSYRIVAVAYDNSESPASDPVSVVLPDTSLPPVPVITGADGSNARATLTFVPGLPEGKTAHFLILRGGGADDLGVVIGDPLPASARRFEDLYVRPGENYWYRLVAVDKNGNRSDPTRPVALHIGAPTIPAAAAPKLAFVREPSPQVRIEFDAPPPGLAAMVQVRAGENGDWVALAGPIEGQSQAVDTNPPKNGRVFYRVFYRAPNGATGSPSPAAELQRP
jgi:hypothetical protein